VRADEIGRITRIVGCLAAVLLGVVVLVAATRPRSAGVVIPTTPGITTTAPPVTVLDLNNDGKADFVIYGSDLVAVPQNPPSTTAWISYGVPLSSALLGVLGGIGAALIGRNKRANR
jgi:hypothetical protein